MNTIKTIQVQGFNTNLYELCQKPMADAEIGDYNTSFYIVVENIWDSISRLVHYYISTHNKIFVVRMTLTFPLSYEVYPSSEHIQLFSKNICEFFSYHRYDPKYVWVRERKQHNSHQHYHFALFLNGNKIQHPYEVTFKANELWQMRLGVNITGLVNYDCSISVRRNEYGYYEQLNTLFYMLQYIAKPNTKVGINDGRRNFACSRF